jgi:cell division protein ZipA
MDDLRLVLIVLGACLVAGIYLWETYRRRRLREDSRRAGADSANEALASAGTASEGGIAPGEDTVEVGDLAALREESSPPSGVAASAGSDHAPAAAAPPRESAQLIVSLALMARPGLRLPGDEVCGALTEVGMRFGEMSIFHHFGSEEVGGENAQPIFSAANLHEPGTFDLEKMAGEELPGLALFMAVPGPMEAEPAFDLMLDVGQRLAELLDAELRDETRSSLTPQSIAHLRERLGDFRRRQLLKAN